MANRRAHVSQFGAQSGAYRNVRPDETAAVRWRPSVSCRFPIASIPRETALDTHTRKLGQFPSGQRTDLLAAVSPDI